MSQCEVRERVQDVSDVRDDERVWDDCSDGLPLEGMHGLAKFVPKLLKEEWSEPNGVGYTRPRMEVLDAQIHALYVQKLVLEKCYGKK